MLQLFSLYWNYNKQQVLQLFPHPSSTFDCMWCMMKCIRNNNGHTYPPPDWQGTSSPISLQFLWYFFFINIPQRVLKGLLKSQQQQQQLTTRMHSFHSFFIIYFQIYRELFCVMENVLRQQVVYCVVHMMQHNIERTTKSGNNIKL